MPKIIFLPSQTEVEVEENTKILAAAVQNKIDFTYSCGAARCGTCLSEIVHLEGRLSEFNKHELELLRTLDQPLDGSMRLACKTFILKGTVKIRQPE